MGEGAATLTSFAIEFFDGMGWICGHDGIRAFPMVLYPSVCDGAENRIFNMVISQTRESDPCHHFSFLQHCCFVSQLKSPPNSFLDLQFTLFRTL